jgi:UDP-sulfoquinovose synthase
VRHEHGLETTISHVPNPRVEAEEHYYNAKHQRLLDLGLQPHFLGDTLLESMIQMVEQHADRVDPVLLEQPSVTWKRGGNEVWDRYSHKRGAAGSPDPVPSTASA